MYWNNGHVIGAATGAGFYEPEPIDGLGLLGLGAIYAGVYNAEVLGAQQVLNALHAALNYAPLQEDGKLGKATCGALQFWFTQAPAELVQLATTEAQAVVAYMQAHPAVGTVCDQQVVKPWTMPTASGPPPQAPPQYTEEQIAYLCTAAAQQDGLVAACQNPDCYMRNQANCDAAMYPPETPSGYTPQQIAYLCQVNAQQHGVLPTCDIPECYALSKELCDRKRSEAAAAPQYTPEQIQYLCMAKIAQDGTLSACDVPECYALNPSGCEELRAEAPRCFAMMASQGVLGTCGDPKCYLLNPAGCDAAAAQAAQAPPPPPPSTPGMTPMPESNACFIHSDGLETCDCYVRPGDRGPHIRHFQEAINVALQAAGYAPIAVTGVWDAATCGAQYTLGGSFRYDVDANQWCDGQDFIFPGDCPQVTMPTRVTAPTLEPAAPTGTKRKMSTAAIVGIGGLLAAAIGGGVYYAKTKAAGGM